MEALNITDTGYPAASRSLLADYQMLEKHHGEHEINQPLFALIQARKAINDARLCCRYARGLNKDKEKVVERLEELAKELAAMEPRFPLTILDNGGNKPRPPIMGKS